MARATDAAVDKEQSLNQYTVRNRRAASDVAEEIAAETPEDAIQKAHTYKWPDLGGRAEVFDSADVPDASNHRRGDEFPVGDAEPILTVKVGEPVMKRPYKILDGEDEGKSREFEVGQGY